MNDHIHEYVNEYIIEKTRKQLEERERKNKNKSRRGRRKKKNNMYFTKETENAIIAYNNTDHPHLRNYIYSTYIQYPFEKLAENIYNTFKFQYFDAPPEDVQNEVISNLIINLDKYKEGKGKAFSYFSVVAKNYLILINNGNYKRYKKSSLLSVMPENWEVEDDYEHRQREKDYNEFKKIMINFWEEHMTTVFTKKRDIQIADAILELFRRSQYIENHNKKAIYLYIREMTDCKTQYITKVINTMKEIQWQMMEEYRARGDIKLIQEEFLEEWY